jgi:endonuclease/exonuclease/phosphatase family metal-dependent hydrolase
MTIKILDINIHKGFGWDGMRSTFKKLNMCIHELNPDLIFFQEILGNQAEALVLDIWPHYGYGKNVAHVKNHYGNAILSKFPIVSSQNFDLSAHSFEHRGLLHSILLINNQTVHLLCVHLGLFRRGRFKQFEKIVSYIRASIAENEAIILAGDFNDWDSRATAPLVQGLKLHEAFLTLHGDYAKTFHALAPILKLDRLYCRGFDIIYAQRLVHSSWRLLSDHIGLEVHLNFASKIK